ncbi:MULTISPECIES: hypothetical protein [unclassified Leptolyngbya]|uniref:hypothetical protein n=1 Tax=unclassified Leptolyngbya TaxID=2650499 RepID=UPI0016825B62|nr:MULTISPECIES: hypothetical protein [unclassified Leptolyngbya]MBD1910641.1 hypothetical protein [Leptolyngbya sp. FACHB-8]MBD2154581.1 hypothetical protein [Leptolyngbya sp. FACHB-16]
MDTILEDAAQLRSPNRKQRFGLGDCLPLSFAADGVVLYSPARPHPLATGSHSSGEAGVS